MKKNIVFLTGSGISKESGIPTFRDSGDGLWNNVSVDDVATINGWKRDQKKVLEFYNACREQMKSCMPNEAHAAIAKLEADPEFNVEVFTQNVDNLHERAGSKNVHHMHGDITECTSSMDPWNEKYWRKIDGPISIGDRAEDESQLRPRIVWFGESVQCMDEAFKIAGSADYMVICGTSLQVYPAAGVADLVPEKCRILIVDPNEVKFHSEFGRDGMVTMIRKPATAGIPEAIRLIREDALGEK